ncbi:MAG: class I SAM-dependent methyltransferase [Thermotogota bacterium]
MVQNRAWKWEKVREDFWHEPSEDVYYYLHRWKEKSLKKILDLGCGMGRHCILFAENGFNVTGFDLSEYGLDVMKEKAVKKKLTINTVHGDVVNLPFEDNTFDAILAYHSVYHVDSEGMDRVIANIKRVLKPGGEVYITLISKHTWSYSANSSSIKIVDENVRLKEEQDGNFLPHFYVNYQDMLTLFKDFEIIRVRQIEDIFDGKSSWHYFLHMRL